MGINKELGMLYSERGYDHSEKYICSKCVSDSYLKKIIRTEGTKCKCSFCGKTATKAASFDVVSSAVMGYIKDNYERSIDVLYYDDETESYAGKTVDTIDILYNLADFISDETEVFEELKKVIHDESYTGEFQIPSELDEELWNRYCSLAKNRKESVETIVSLCKREDKPKDIEELNAILDIFIGLSRSMKLTRYISSRTPIYRTVNFHDFGAVTPGFDKLVAAQIGTPPPMFCGENRFSEKGDMVFYGANNKEITKKEIGKRKPDKPYTIGTFYTSKRITIIDFSSIAKWKRPSIFDLENKGAREKWFFLDMFVKLISQEIKDDKNFYKPTQLLLKYIQRKTDYSGISYRSSKSKDKDSNKDICYALFVTNRNCLDESERKAKENSNTLKLYMKSYVQEF